MDAKPVEKKRFNLYLLLNRNWKDYMDYYARGHIENSRLLLSSSLSLIIAAESEKEAREIARCGANYNYVLHPTSFGLSWLNANLTSCSIIGCASDDCKKGIVVKGTLYFLPPQYSYF